VRARGFGGKVRIRRRIRVEWRFCLGRRIRVEWQVGVGR